MRMYRCVAPLVTGVLLAGAAVGLPRAAEDGPAPAPDRGDDAPLPRFEPVAPREAEGTFRALGGFRMDLLAAEPMLADPVAGAYDEDGRLYLAEMADYPHVEAENDKPFADNTGDPPIGRVRLLIDENDDGVFDTSHLFAEGLSWPTGMVPWKGGIFVAATPDIWYLKDTNGDGKADVRERVFTGFRKHNVQAVMNNLAWGLDHLIYGAASGNGGQVVLAAKPEGPPTPVLRRDFRFDPDTDGFEAISGGARFGNTFDDWGNRFLCNIRNPAVHVVLPARYLARNARLVAPGPLHDAAPAGDTIPMRRISPPEPWRTLRAQRWSAIGKALPKSELVDAGYLTSASGVTSYRGDAYPPEFRGNLFLGEVANNLIHRMSVRPDGVTFRATKADPGDTEFVASTDTWCRPVNFINAPDGTLHVIDMYRETIEHPWSIPDDIRAKLDLRSGADRGRIYRLSPPGFKHRPTPKLGRATTEQLVALLAHPNAWHRETAHRLIRERRDPAAVAPLRELLHAGDVPLGRLHALWSLAGLGALAGPEGERDLLGALGDDHAGVREHAVLLAEPFLARSPALRRRVLEMAGDDDIRVRFQVAFTLDELEGTEVVQGLAEIGRRDADDPWVRTAILSSVDRTAPDLFEWIVARKGGAVWEAFGKSPGGTELVRSLAAQIGARGEAAGAARALRAVAAVEGAGSIDWKLGIVLALADGLRGSGIAPRSLAADPKADAEVIRLFDDLDAYVSDTLLERRNAGSNDVERGIAWLGHRPLAESGLGRFLAPTEPQAVQRAAARALGRYPDAEVGPMLLQHWRGYAPAMRGEVLQALLGRAAWHPALLDAIEAGTVEPGQVPAARRSALLGSKDLTIKERAALLLGSASSASRGEVVDRYRKALDALTAPAVAGRGRAIYERECSACHSLGTQGHAVGPNLASVSRRTPEEVLIHVLDPNREVAPDFLEYTVALEDGRVVAGLIDSESASSLTLKRAGGESETVLRDQIEEIASAGRSLMPEGLEKNITPAEMADLIAYILQLQAL